ncbi:MAG: hypothetical protein OK438_05945 [Thaumarchaeota archaeon]|nr:hypothetical protein [Nitrososphaerota archaeon]
MRKSTSMLAAVILCLGLLAASALYYEGVPRGGTGTSARSGTLSSQATLVESNVTINGTKYWSGTLTLFYNLTSISFGGVTFNFSDPCNYHPSGVLVCRDKLVNMWCSPYPYIVATICQEPLPQVKMVFADGSMEYFNKATMINGTMWSDFPRSYPWFTSHLNPRVGIELNTNHAPPDTLTLLVSA